MKINELFLGVAFGALLFVALILLSGCGVDVKHSGNAKANVEISLDKKIEGYFRASCSKQMSPLGASEAQIDECAAAATGEFLASISK